MKDAKGNALIIENKIYAGDQNNQLLRYNNYAKKYFSKEKYVILYLTLDGYSPSEESTGKPDEKINDESKGLAGENSGTTRKVPFEYTCISYRQDILNWLEHCAELSARHPLIRETIQQYIINLKDIMNIMEETNMVVFYEKLEEYSEATAAILSHSDGYKKHVYNTKVKPILIEEAKKRNLIFEDYNIFANRGNRGFLFYKNEWKAATIRMWSDWNFEKRFYWGISLRSGKPFETKKQKLDCFNMEPTDWNPYGWKRLDEYCDWCWETYTAMVKGEYTKYIMDNVDKILEEIKEKQLPL